MDIKIAQQETITELVLENQKLKQERDEWRKSAFEITEQATKSRKELERELNIEKKIAQKACLEIARLERERDKEAKDYELHIAKLCEAYNHLGEQNAKLRDIAEKTLDFLSSCGASETEEWVQLHDSLDQLKKEDAERPHCSADPFRKWKWMMDYCKRKGMSPTLGWGSAEEAFLKTIGKWEEKK